MLSGAGRDLSWVPFGVRTFAADESACFLALGPRPEVPSGHRELVLPP